MIPILLCVSCAWVFPNLLTFVIDKGTEPTYYDRYTKPVQNVCRQYDFDVADNLNFVEGYQRYVMREGTEYAFLFCMDEETYQSEWETYIGEKNFLYDEKMSYIPSSLSDMEEKYDIEFLPGYFNIKYPYNSSDGTYGYSDYGAYCFYLISEKQKDGLYYVYFYREG
ncbi:MAG: hypothetical protein ACI3XR_03825 [Eubacteriales bacterium]